jgi:hypothetical protein
MQDVEVHRTTQPILASVTRVQLIDCDQFVDGCVSLTL